jgi:hypothetical protein
MARIVWNGGAIKARVSDAAALGIDKTMSDCVADARGGHEAYPPASEPGERYANRTNFAVAATDIMEPASPVGDGHVKGRWGSRDETALFVEIGTSRKDSGFPRAQAREAAADGDMNAIPPPSDPALMEPRPTLRPAADAHYPGLSGYIGAAYRGESLE